jgi:dUTP pyrophosphatase
MKMSVVEMWSSKEEKETARQASRRKLFMGEDPLFAREMEVDALFADINRQPIANTSTPPLMRGTKNSAGHDIKCLHDVVLPPLSKAVAETGLSLNLNDGYYAKIEGRSGIAFKNSVIAFGGVIDSDYKESINVLLFNLGEEEVILPAGSRIAQLLVMKYEVLDNSTIISTAPHTGFGSTGIF